MLTNAHKLEFYHGWIKREIGARVVFLAHWSLYSAACHGSHNADEITVSGRTECVLQLTGIKTASDDTQEATLARNSDRRLPCMLTARKRAAGQRHWQHELANSRLIPQRAVKLV